MTGTAAPASFRVRGGACPHCRHRLDAATILDASGQPSAPEPDDLTICCYCGTILVFTAARSLRAMTPADVNDLTPGQRQRLWRYRAQIIALLRCN